MQNSLCHIESPNPENKKALEIYGRIGMIEKEIPAALRSPEYSQTYFEMTRN